MGHNRIEEYSKDLEEEFEEKRVKLAEQEEDDDSWALFNECKRFLEENDKGWAAKKAKGIQEEKKAEILMEVRREKEILKEKDLQRVVKIEKGKLSASRG